VSPGAVTVWITVASCPAVQPRWVSSQFSIQPCVVFHVLATIARSFGTAGWLA
jgi:hypothetical protein